MSNEVRARNESETTRITISTSAEVATYLDQLTQLGIHGKTRSEVAKTLIGNSLERLMKDGLLIAQRGGKPT